MASNSVAGTRAANRAAARAHKLDRLRGSEVLAAAGEVFADLGYDGATIQDIADRLGMLKGSLYYYIDNKEDLLDAFVTDTYDRLTRQLLEPVSKVEGSGLERVEAYVRLNVDANARHLSAAAVLSGDFRSVSDEIRVKLANERSRHDAFLRSLVEQGQADGSIRPDIAAGFVSTSILSMCNAIYKWYRTDGRWTPAEVADMTWQLLEPALKPSN